MGVPIGMPGLPRGREQQFFFPFEHMPQLVMYLQVSNIEQPPGVVPTGPGLQKRAVGEYQYYAVDPYHA